MANITMRTELTLWTLDESISKWTGKCLECRGEKAQYTPQILKNKGLKPCSLCTDIKAYDRCSANKENKNA